jgi:hypothetical protein
MRPSLTAASTVDVEPSVASTVQTIFTAAQTLPETQLALNLSQLPHQALTKKSK